MVNSPLVLGVITARGGSKGVPRKNVKLLQGKPLIGWTIEAAQKSQRLTHCIVSTDDEEIARVSRAYGVDVPFLRPKELAEDTTPHLPVMQHAVAFMEKELGVRFDIIVILQPTSPLRTASDIDETVRLLIEKDADSAVTVIRCDTHPMNIKVLDPDGTLSPAAMEETEGLRRQDIPEVYERSGDVCVMKRDVLMDRHTLYGIRQVGYVIPKERWVTIDTEEDWKRAERLVQEM